MSSNPPEYTERLDWLGDQLNQMSLDAMGSPPPYGKIRLNLRTQPTEDNSNFYCRVCRKYLKHTTPAKHNQTLIHNQNALKSTGCVL